jgi:glyoxylase-like metal-dependent hydrolase (beta-lactamase superfamily II)
MTIGKYQIDSVDAGRFALDGGAMFGVVPKALWSKAYHSGDEMNRIPLAARPLLLRSNKKTILIDTGNGTKLNEKLRQIYSIDNEKSSIELALSRLNVKPDDVTDVILTHLHFDHTGGSTKYENGKVVPTFPKAKYYVQREQFIWAKSPTEKDRASFFIENFIPLESEGNLELIDGDGELFESVRLLTFNGHTKAMQLIKISDVNNTLLYCADLCPTSAHINLAYIMGYDNFPLTTLEEKKKIIPQACEEGWIVAFEHDAFIQAGKIIKTDKGFAIGDKITITD